MPDDSLRHNREFNRSSLEITDQQNMRLSGDSRGTAEQMFRQSIMQQPSQHMIEPFNPQQIFP